MREQTKQQKGSPSRDLFKRKHKDLSRKFYACDLDFVFVEKEPFPDIIAVIDYKKDTDDEITFAEVVAYNALMRRGITVYIVTGDAESGAFIIYRYEGGHHGKPRWMPKEVFRCDDWDGFAKWESSLREYHHERYRASP